MSHQGEGTGSGATPNRTPWMKMGKKREFNASSANKFRHNGGIHRESRKEYRSKRPHAATLTAKYGDGGKQAGRGLNKRFNTRREEEAIGFRKETRSKPASHIPASTSKFHKHSKNAAGPQRTKNIKILHRNKELCRVNEGLQASLNGKNALVEQVSTKNFHLKSENEMLRTSREEKIHEGVEAYKSSYKTTPEYRQELKDYMIENGDFIYEDRWNKSVAHLRQWYPITDEQAVDPNLMDSTPNAANPTN
ncbi:hypothetical protein Sjap_002318 [Stephania japonica]|uniref:Uncharacterized protein n=1 Tax=Stephania japonica TaxID=461633 RepID=A0AAP0PSF1_9MAGN